MAWFGKAGRGRIGTFFGNRPTMVAYWQMEGSSRDNTGGTAGGSDTAVIYKGSGSRPTAATERFASYDGASSQTSGALPSTYNPCSLFIWYRPRSAPSAYYWTSYNNTNLGFQVRTTGQLYVQTYNGSGGPYFYSTGTNFNDGKWHLLVMRVNGGTVDANYDGKFLNSGSGATVNVGGNFWVGSDFGTVNGAVFDAGEMAFFSEYIPDDLIAQYYAWATKKKPTGFSKWLKYIFNLNASVTMMNAASRYATVQRVMGRARSATVSMMNAASRFATAKRALTWSRSASVSMMNSASRYATAAWHEVIVWTRTASVSMMNSASRFAKATKTLIIKISNVIRWNFFTWD
ncbi:MAG TPA: LamG-like jellyroll fold domain-containing protein [Patescibacteria group bacterium]|nr:LamG-like jellyroll fold domain-containing protein [Patescibacteria group bacterium]